MPIIEYGEKELAWLARRDKKLGAFIERTGFLERELEPDLFAALVSSIATQQISNAAAETVMKRFEQKFRLTPSALAAATVEEIQSVGISFRKASYIKGFCDAVNQGLDLEALRVLPDEEVAARLLPVKGIGPWTVEMFLIFSLGRPDVVSFGDYAIRKGMANLYGLKDLDKAKFARFRKRYVPYGTVASFYLWEAAVV